MPHEITLNEIPVGYALTNSKDGKVDVRSREFTSSEDGDLFITRLEGIPRMLLSLIPDYSVAVESSISHMLAIIRADKTAKIYVNDIDFIASARAKGNFKKGDWITLDNILDIERIDFQNAKVESNQAVVYVFSAGWRKGLFYDLMPLNGDKKERDYDLGSVLGFYTAYLHFQHLYSLRDETWEEFFKQGWFPFIYLRQNTLKAMIGTAKGKDSIDGHLAAIAKDVEGEVSSRLEAWRSHPVLAPHFQFIETAFRHFKNGDFLSTSMVLFPRIEGVMRTHHFTNVNALRASQKNLAASAVSKAPIPSHNGSLLLPERFERFLVEKYFAGFDAANPQGLSRNTVAHGVVPESLLNQKGACIGFLILLQLVSLFPFVDSQQKLFENE
jgi:hypothetical protein